MSSCLYKTINDLTYLYSIPSVDGFIVSILPKNTSIQVIDVTENWATCNFNNSIVYIYIFDLLLVEPLLSGDILIKFINENDDDIFPPILKRDLALGNYSFEAKNICGYILNDTTPKTVMLNENNLNVTITFKYKKDIIFENLILSYIDSETNEALAESRTFDVTTVIDPINPLISLDNYELISTNKFSKLITNIQYNFIKSTGSIIIKYLDKNTSIELSDTDYYNNLNYGEYKYTSKILSGFSVVGDTTKSVTLDSNNRSQTIIFYYKTDYLELQESYQNEVPYISTYYINPIAKINEDVTIDFYITDYYHTNYIKNDLSELYTVTLKINDFKTIIKTNLAAGDHSINIGSFEEEREYTISLFCTDKYGRNSHKLFNSILIKSTPTINEYIMSKQDLIDYNITSADDYEEVRLLNVSLNEQSMTTALTTLASSIAIPENKYVCFIGDSNNDGIRDSKWNETIVKYSEAYDKNAVLLQSKNTRIGLQKLLDDKKAQGYSLLKLLTGTYRIDNEEPLYIPSNFTLDLNNSTIKQNQFTGFKSLMLDLNNTFDSHVINGTIDGDYYSHDYTNSTNYSEGVMGISISGESKYSSFENITIKNITGYGAGNGIAKSRNNLLDYYYVYPISIGNTFVLGDIDRTTGNSITSTNRTTCDYIDISKYSEIGYIIISKYLGAQGNPCGTWNIICHFYDKNKTYIESIDSYQYRRVQIPNASYYLKVTILNVAYPTDLTVNLMRVPINCCFKNIIFNNCRCVGLAQSAMKNMLVENCEFINCGQYLAKCAYDAEDGADMMQDVTFRGLNFHDNPYNDFLTAAGHNFIIENMVNGKIYIWPRTNSYVIRNSTNISGITALGYDNRVRSGYIRIYNNTINGNCSIKDSANTDLPVLIKYSTINGRAEGNSLLNSIYFKCNIGANNFASNEYSNSLGTSTFNNCIIHDKKGSYHYSGIYNNCTLKNIIGNAPGNLIMNNCTLTDINYSSAYAGNSQTFTNCTFNNSAITFGYWFKGCIITINNCKIYNTNYLLKLPHYSMKYPITLTNNYIESTGTNGIIYYYDDRTGGSAGELTKQDTLTLTNNHFSIQNSHYVINGLNKNTINNINIILENNTIIPTTAYLYNPDAKNSSNITISEK